MERHPKTDKLLEKLLKEAPFNLPTPDPLTRAATATDSPSVPDSKQAQLADQISSTAERIAGLINRRTNNPGIETRLWKIAMALDRICELVDR